MKQLSRRSKESGNAEEQSSTIVMPKNRFDASRPHFSNIGSKDAKVELDDRFKSVLTDTRFELQVVDKYGRKSNGPKGKISREELGGFYTSKDDVLRHSNSVHSPVLPEISDIERAMIGKRDELFPTNMSSRGSDQGPVARIAYLTALSRGEVESASSSDEDEENSVENVVDESDDDGRQNEPAVSETLGILDPSYNDIETLHVEFTSSESPFLAVMNADWSHLRAVDIFAIVSSFVPLGTVIHVTVYPSNFGLERLHKEDRFGPVDVWKAKSFSSNNMNEDGSHDIEVSNDHVDDYKNDTVWDDEANEFDPEKLRLYETSRLKYFFAVVEFVDAQYADIAYKEIDGMEFEHSSAALDLRIIPVDEISAVTSNRNSRDEATALPSNYNPPDFVVNALQQSTVRCTWDLGDPNRESLLTKYSVSGQSWGNVAESDDLKIYLASDQSSDDESLSGGRKSNALRNILGLDSNSDEDNGDCDTKRNISDVWGCKDKKEFEIQASFIPGKVNNTIEQKNDLTPWDKYQEKRRQKRREKRAASREKRKQISNERKGQSASLDCNFDDDVLYQLVNKDGINDDKRDFDMRSLERVEKKKLRQLKGEQSRKDVRLATNVVGMDFQINTRDERFKEFLEGTDERFGIDRTDSNFKETSAMHTILEDRSRNRKKRRKLDQVDSLCTTEVSPDVCQSDLTPTPCSSGTLVALVANIKENFKR